MFILDSGAAQASVGFFNSLLILSDENISLNSVNHRKTRCPGVLGSGGAPSLGEEAAGRSWRRRRCHAVCWSQGLLHVRGGFANGGLRAFLLHEPPCRETAALLGVLAGFLKSPQLNNVGSSGEQEQSLAVR